MAGERRASPANYVKKAAGNLGVSCGNDEQDFVYGNDEQDFVYSPDGDEQIPTLARGLPSRTVVPVGTVTFAAETTTLGTVSLAGGKASLTVAEYPSRKDVAAD